MRWMKWMRQVTCCAVLLIAGASGAHELTCEETLDGSTRRVLDTYPAQVTLSVTVRNVAPGAVSVATSIEGVLTSYEGISFDTPVSLPVGDSVTKTISVSVSTYEACLALAALDGTDDGRLVAPVTVEFDTGSAQCTAELICEPPVCQPPTVR